MPAELNPSKRTVLEIAADLADGRTTSRELVEAALAQITDPAGEGARTFVKVYTENARAAADAQDRLRRAGYVASPLAGLPVSLKDLFDAAGERTLAGSKALDDRWRRGSTSAATGSPLIRKLTRITRSVAGLRPASRAQ
jgi:aspartyl-tRNA(Asn)/glutamyl-tRNA(Gln) amidotransferase subunit A